MNYPGYIRNIFINGFLRVFEPLRLSVIDLIKPDTDRHNPVTRNEIILRFPHLPVNNQLNRPDPFFF